MSSVVISGDVSGSVTLQAPSAAGTTVLTLPSTTGSFITTTGGVTPGTAGNLLTSDGTAWTSAAPAPGTAVGTIITFAGTSAPTGYLLCPTSLTNISRTTYASLFAVIGTTWGSGDGSTTFGLPWFTADFAPVQASANVGTSTTGSVISHTHTQSTTMTAGFASSFASTISIASTVSSGSYGGINNTGGTNNLAAGARVLFCIKF